ncbi:glutathione-specific gamma-glutamylcyclotransferase 1 [Pyrgilauda ruficollis]|nr:glutathione-specific gamma-glutamylcyclotransferase 1 [Pyrgilauda ruficollis]
MPRREPRTQRCRTGRPRPGAPPDATRGPLCPTRGAAKPPALVASPGRAGRGGRPGPPLKRRAAEPPHRPQPQPDMKRDPQQPEESSEPPPRPLLSSSSSSSPSGQAEGAELAAPVWIFGYGSLVWRPGFEFTSRKVGFIRGYSRRFWQGDTFHRGSEKTPGRVVTLLEDCGACTWGVAYEVRGEQIAASLEYLNMREAVLGGYDTKLVKFHPQEKDAEEPILALVYIATPQNPSYLGPASEEDIAAQIIVSSGCAGHNIEYLLRLADFMRYFCPQAEDKHLFSIEEALISILPCLYYTEESLEETASVPQKSKG